MILPFSTHWPKTITEHLSNKPTHFTEKIWSVLISEKSEVNISDYEKYFNEHQERFNKSLSDYEELLIDGKYHTIRADKKDRWKAGRGIHFVINNRSKNQFQFAPVIKCVSTQTIEIKHNIGHVQIDIEGECFGEVFHHGLDDIYQYTNDIETLAKNDGFNSVEDFFAWFNEDFKGKIIHWTNLKY